MDEEVDGPHAEAVQTAAAALDRADAVVVTAGAGIGVDSGLPDFRGDEGFWAAYPPYRHLGRSFVEMANPAGFRSDPEFAWGFYGHRRALYRRTTPHDGFAILRRFIDRAPRGGFVVTSNVDGQFQTAGLDPDAIWEVHGTIHLDQCLDRCGAPPFPAGPDVVVDETTMRARPPLPACPRCGGLARPNILMFGDWDHDPTLSNAQERRFDAFLRARPDAHIVVVEVGAGTTVATIRYLGERYARAGDLIRINPREPHGPPGTISIPSGARAGLAAIAAAREVIDAAREV
jgi:NAD-dependent SIR2 family protein deacetylase